MWVVADLEGFQPVRLEIGGGPYLGDLPDGNAHVLGHQPQAPVSRLTRYTLGRQGQDFLDLRLVELAWMSAAREVAQPIEASFLITLAPFEYDWRRNFQPIADLLGREAAGQQQQNSGTLPKVLRQSSHAQPALQRLSIRGF
ncbi:hypothetical protein D9M68_844230 [compost metagenome]